MREFRISTSGLLPSDSVTTDRSHIDPHRALTSEVCSGEDVVSRASSVRVDPLLEYLERSWGEPTPDSSPLYCTSKNSHGRHTSDLFLPREEGAPALDSPLVPSSPLTLEDSGQPETSVRQTDSAHMLGRLPVLLSPALPWKNRHESIALALTSKHAPCHFESNITMAPEDDDGDDGFALESAQLEHTPDLPQLQATYRDDDSHIQETIQAISSDEDVQGPLRQGEVSSSSKYNVWQHQFGNDVGKVLELTNADIPKIFHHFRELMVTAVVDAVHQRTNVATTNPTSEYPSSFSSEARTFVLEPPVCTPPSVGTGDETSSRVGRGNSANVNINVCYHWRSKGLCSYEGRCKFMHPSEKRGVGKAMLNSKRKGILKH